MHLRRILKSQKAQIDQATNPVSGMTLTAFLVLIIIAMVVSTSSLFGQEPDEVLLAEFRWDFVPLFESVANGSSAGDYEVVEYLALGPNQIIAIFSENENPKGLHDFCQANEWFKKPDVCGNNICVCLCSEKDSCKRPFECFPIKNSRYSDVRVSPSFDANFGFKKDILGDDVLIYGDCDGPGGEPFGSRGLLIEGKGTTIHISDEICRTNKGTCTVLGIGQACANGVMNYACPHTRPICCAD